MDPLKRQIFRDAFAQIFSLILRPCRIHFCLHYIHSCLLKFLCLLTHQNLHLVSHSKKLSNFKVTNVCLEKQLTQFLLLNWRGKIHPVVCSWQIWNVDTIQLQTWETNLKNLYFLSAFDQKLRACERVRVVCLLEFIWWKGSQAPLPSPS